MLIMITLLSYLFCFLNALKNDTLTVIKARADDAIPITRGKHIPVYIPHHSIAKQTAPRHVIVA